MRKMSMIELFGTLFLLIHQGSGQCPTKCFCLDGFITCTGLKSIPSVFPDDTRYLTISDIDVEFIPAGVFDKLPLLESIEIYDGKVGTISTDAFSALSDVESISLSELSIEVIESYAFNNITDTGSVVLDISTIDVIKPYAFFDLFALDHIKITSNNVKSIESFAFSSIDDLLEFSFQSNYVKTMKPFAFSQFSNLYEFSMYLNTFGNIGCGSIEALLDETMEQAFYSNNFNCTCNIIWALNNPSMTKYLFSNTCQLPRTDLRVKWEDVSVEALQCNNEENYECPPKNYFEMLIPNVRVISSPLPTTTKTGTSTRSFPKTMSHQTADSKTSQYKSTPISTSTKTSKEVQTETSRLQQSTTQRTSFRSSQRETKTTTKTTAKISKPTTTAGKVTATRGKQTTTKTDVNIKTTKSSVYLSSPKIVVIEMTTDLKPENKTKSRGGHNEPVSAVINESGGNGANFVSLCWFCIIATVVLTIPVI
ncbi:slit homolog 1 protein-like [Ruditapes philippinarum]|uniref:slit homolog 1 protein-like n=1 Tax=Ruditapes philippinarum TaxID=129788 RepID=UPI00295AE4D4|nr:slit homolog 1 protein-like [Ruditapes philippinarum]